MILQLIEYNKALKSTLKNFIKILKYYQCFAFDMTLSQQIISFVFVDDLSVNMFTIFGHCFDLGLCCNFLHPLIHWWQHIPC